jgi:hypothetical protein
MHQEGQGETSDSQISSFLYVHIGETEKLKQPFWNTTPMCKKSNSINIFQKSVDLGFSLELHCSRGWQHTHINAYISSHPQVSKVLSLEGL